MALKKPDLSGRIRILDSSGLSYLVDFARDGQRYKVASAEAMTTTAWRKAGSSLQKSMRVISDGIPKR